METKHYLYIAAVVMSLIILGSTVSGLMNSRSVEPTPTPLPTSTPEVCPVAPTPRLNVDNSTMWAELDTNYLIAHNLLDPYCINIQAYQFMRNGSIVRVPVQVYPCNDMYSNLSVTPVIFEEGSPVISFYTLNDTTKFGFAPLYYLQEGEDGS